MIEFSRRMVGSVAVCLLVVACGGNDAPGDRERAMEDMAAKHGLDIDVDLDASGEVEQVIINAGAGQVGSGLSLPDGFPEDVAIPAEWNIISSSAPMPETYMVQTLTDDTSESILRGLRQDMSSAGWNESDFAEMTPQIWRINFDKDDRMTAFTITSNGETNAVQIVSMPKP